MMGPAFKTKRAEHPKDYLDAALQAERYVRAHLHETEDGLLFEKGDGLQSRSLYSGAAGILHMYLVLRDLTGKDSYDRLIDGLVKHLSLHCLDDSDGKGERFPGITKSFYSGLAGIGLVLAEADMILDSKDARQGLQKLLAFYHDSMVSCEGGVCWTDNPQVYFDGGVLLFLIEAYRRLSGRNSISDRGEWIYPAIVKAADYMVQNGSVKNDTLEITRTQLAFKKGEPNFEFGTAGCGYVFLKVYELTKDEKYLTAAIQCARYIRSIADAQERGILIPYKPAVYDDLYYLGNCHGPVGTAKLFYELYELTAESEYLDDVEQLYRGAESLGAPLRQSKGFWNTMCLCCGPSGYIPFLIGLEKKRGDGYYREKARQVGDVLLGEMSTIRGTDTDYFAWRFAFDRTKPDELSAAAGYYNGAAGNVALLAYLYYYLAENKEMIHLIDDPY